MESTSVISGGSCVQAVKWPTVIVFKELHTLIGTVKEIGSITTMDEVLEGMKKYILDKQLFDPSNPIRVCCKDDQLGSVLGVEEFTIAQVKTLLMKVVTPVPNIRNCCKYGHIKLCKEEKECIFSPLNILRLHDSPAVLKTLYQHLYDLLYSEISAQLF